MTTDSVIFDVGNVLFRWDLRALFAKLIDDAGELDWFLVNVVTPEWHFQHDAGRPLDPMIAERCAAFPDHAALIRAYRARFNETIPGPVDGMIELVRALDRAGVPLFAITNFGAEFWRGFRPNQPVFDLFADIVVSGDERLAKPDPAIFRLALDRFGRPAARFLFVDDREENVAAARVIGMAGHIFTGAASLRAELERRDLL